MPRRKKYSQEYIDTCREKLTGHVEAYRKLVMTARKQAAKNGGQLDRAIESFEPHFFNNMVLVLDCHFADRERAIEKRDGNPLNEVRMISSSLVTDTCMLIADKTIKYNPSRAVLRYQLGDKIKVHEADFERLCDAFFDEIEAKYL
jgi:hypothetical protein